MLLIWLLVPAASAMMDCRRACDLCQTSSDPLARLNSCSLCKECVLTMKRRMMELHLPNQQKVRVEGEVLFPSKGDGVLNGKVLSDKQTKELKDLEKKEFAKMMKEYGWNPQDFLEDDKPQDNNEECVPEKICLHDSDDFKEQPKDDIEKLINVPSSKTQQTTCQPQIVCPEMPQIVCPPYCLSTTVTTTSISCPPVIPCDEEDKLIGPVLKSSTMPFGRRRNYFLRQLARLEAAEAEVMGCPPQPICSDEEDYRELLKISSTRAPHKRRSTGSISTNKTPPKANCVACAPPCPLPCPLYPALFPPPIPIPYPLPQSIPPQALQTLMTPTTAIPQKKEKIPYIDNSVNSNNEDSDDEEQEKMLSKEKATKDTTIIYVKILTDAKKLRRG